MTRYFKTWYGYKSYDGNWNSDGIADAVAVFLVVGIIIWLCAKLFIPIVIIDVIYLIYCCQNKQYSLKVLILLGLATLITGFCFFGTADSGQGEKSHSNNTVQEQQDNKPDASNQNTETNRGYDNY